MIALNSGAKQQQVVVNAYKFFLNVEIEKLKEDDFTEEDISDGEAQRINGWNNALNKVIAILQSDSAMTNTVGGKR